MARKNNLRIPRRMSMEDFFRELSTLGPMLQWEMDPIIGLKGVDPQSGFVHCPITALYWYRTSKLVDPDDYQDPARELGLTRRQADLISDAADRLGHNELLVQMKRAVAFRA
jgi:hypothetical protein